MKSLSVSKIRSYILIAAFCLITAGIGYQLGVRHASISLTSDKRVVINQEAPPSATIDFSLFWTVWQKLSSAYIDKTILDPQKMVYGAITGMVNSLGDPYTLFLPPKDNKDFKDELAGDFEGIGAQLDMKDGNIIVLAPLKGTPAEKAGIKPLDYILKVDGIDTTGWTVAQAVSKIRGPKGTSVKLSILHEKATKPVDLTITRDTITVPSIESWVKPVSDIKEISGITQTAALSAKGYKVAYIILSRFGDTTNDDWTRTVSDISTQLRTDPSIKGLIFDLRNNPGGYLESAVYIASEFIKSGTVVSQVNSDATKQDYPVERMGKFLDIPVVVLINKGSASAAEIVAGALRDYKRATIVGETSFGKGSVQTPEDLPGGAGLHITTGKWLLPKGDSISKKGITPEFVISLPDNVTATTDAQLEKAVEILVK
jgi:carboxyl-terminal processing protease